jgi:ubiquinone/menaquinone biosynthesis C-methylase UbiE
VEREENMTQPTPEIKSRIRNYWDKSANSYDNSFGHGIKTDHEKQLWLDLLCQNINGEKQLDILDVGSGTGFLSLLLAELGHNVTGIDLSPEMRKQARQKADKNKLHNATFIHGDAENPPFPAQSFDAIISRHVVWTLPAPDIALDHWLKLLKPDGTVIVIDGVWTPRSASGRLRYLLASTIRLMQGRTGHLFWKKKYAQRDELPFFGGAEPETVIQLLEKLGYKDCWLDRMTDILEHERRKGPLDYRITHAKNRRYLIGGKV